MERPGKSRSVKYSLTVLGALIGGALIFQDCTGTGTSATCTFPSVTIDHTANYADPGVQTNFINTTLFPTAVCNDGSPGFYSFRAGFGAASQRWVIYLEGGSNCYDQASCSSRASGSPNLVSSVAFQNRTATLALDSGLLSNSPSGNPDFYDANIVEIGYCSSDLWSGAKAAAGAYSASDVNTWNFQGRAIISAVLQDLTTSHGLSSAREVLWAGGSAGGLGVFYTFNDVLTRLPSTIRAVASPDGGYFIRVAPYDSSNPPTYAGTVPTENAALASGMPLWNGRGEGGCDSAAVTTADHLACYGPVTLVQTNRYSKPLFIRESYQDTFQLSSNGITLVNGTTTQTGGTVYLQYFAQQMLGSLQGLNSLYSIFGINEVSHTVYITSRFATNQYSFTGVAPISISQALGQWYRNPCQAPQLLQSAP